jgi:hypothetical protein
MLTEGRGLRRFDRSFYKDTNMQSKQPVDTHERNPDPITKAPGSHPVGTGVGAAAGGAAGIGAAVVAGAAIGSAVGPVGTAVGAAVGATVGAVAGGLAGKAVAEEINPTVEETYWRETYLTRPYVTPGTPYEDYGPAYQHGWESHVRHLGKTFVEVERDLEHAWARAKGKSRLKWDQAKAASRDAWDRIDRRKK